MSVKQVQNSHKGQWKKGQSGNLKGRPPKVKCIPDILKAIGQEQVNREGLTKLDAVMNKVFHFAVEGRPWAVQFIADRTEGKAKEFRETTVKTEPIKVFDFDD